MDEGDGDGNTNGDRGLANGGEGCGGSTTTATRISLLGSDDVDTARSIATVLAANDAAVAACADRGNGDGGDGGTGDGDTDRGGTGDGSNALVAPAGSCAGEGNSANGSPLPTYRSNADNGTRNSSTSVWDTTL